MKKKQQSEKNDVEHYLLENFSFFTNCFQEMVNINSHSNNTDGLNKLAAVTAEYFQELGFVAELIPSEYSGGAHHLKLFKQGRGEQSIVLLSHLDTVFTREEEQENKIQWRVDGDRIYGPGTNDVKGGTVIILMMMHVLKRFYQSLFDDVSWVVLLDATEETRSDDFGGVCIDSCDAATRACLVFESGGFMNNTFSLVTSRKGRAVFRVSVHGKSAHAGSNHQDGVNAIVHLSYMIQKFAGLTDYAQGLTVNIGTISGGSTLNRVPHYASVDLEMRASDHDVFEKARKTMLSFNGYKSKIDPEDKSWAGVTVELIRQVPAWPVNELTGQLFEVWVEAGKLLKYSVREESRGGLSDGNWVWHRVPTIDGLGPAGADEHSAGEYVMISSFVPKIILNCEALRLLLEKR